MADKNLSDKLTNRQMVSRPNRTRTRSDYDKTNAYRIAKRTEAKRVKQEVAREGAREEIITAMVGGIIKRLLTRKRNNDRSKAKREADPKAHNSKRRVMIDRRLREAHSLGISVKEHMKNRAIDMDVKSKPFHDHNKYIRERERVDDKFRIRRRLGNRISEFLKLVNGTKAAGTMELVGCTKEQLLKHLENTKLQKDKFKDLSIDHIFPCKIYNLVDSDEQRKCFHYSNLQMLPLYGPHGNVAKRDQLPTKTMAAKVDRDKWPPGITEDMLPDIYPGWATPLRIHAAPTPGASSSTDPVKVTDDASASSSDDDDVSESSFDEDAVSESSSDDNDVPESSSDDDDAE